MWLLAFAMMIGLALTWRHANEVGCKCGPIKSCKCGEGCCGQGKCTRNKCDCCPGCKCEKGKCKCDADHKCCPGCTCGKSVEPPHEHGQAPPAVGEGNKPKPDPNPAKPPVSKPPVKKPPVKDPCVKA